MIENAAFSDAQVIVYGERGAGKELVAQAIHEIGECRNGPYVKRITAPVSPITVDVRIISATNWDLPKLVEMGKFRKDFFFRINVIPIHLPPLRDRMEDIPLLAETFFQKMRLKSDKNVKGISKQAIDALMNYDWPGNVRELKSAFEYAFVTCHEELILPGHLPPAIYRGKRPALAEPKRPSFDMRGIEKQELIEALKKTGSNQSKAADLLGVSRVTVYNRMKRYGINTTRNVEIS